MKTLSRLVHVEIVQAVFLVVAGFLGLFVFFDLVEELKAVNSYGAMGYNLAIASGYVALSMPSHLYELLPIGVLIGTIFVMSRMAQRSEFTVLRTSGLSPRRALTALIAIGSLFMIMTFMIGDYLSPMADRQASILKTRFTGGQTSLKTGAWLKERQADRHFVINVQSMLADGELAGIQLFEFHENGDIGRLAYAARGRIDQDDSWVLQDVDQIEFGASSASSSTVTRQKLQTWKWPNKINADMISATLQDPERMNTISLYQYISHLRANDQDSQKFEIVFWRKVFYPLSCLVMVVLSLPFAYLHHRSGSIAGQVFVGVIVGISFFLLNNLFGYIGTLNQWQPWLASALPSLMYSLVSLSAFAWLVLRH